MELKPRSRTLSLELRHKGRRGRYHLNWVSVGEWDETTSPEHDSFQFTSRHALHTGNSRVFKGTLKIGDEVYPKQVVCKLVSGDTSRSRSEAEFYVKNLKTVQGLLVPKFIGLFYGTSKYTGEDVGCILLEYGGEALKDDWSDIPIVIRSKVMGELLQLHRIGVYHNDFRPENFVIDETGQPRMIDFEGAEMHQCLLTKWEFTMYEPEPLRAELKCPEVCEASMEMDIWTPVEVAFHGIVVDIREIKTVEDLVEIAMQCKPHSSFTIEEWTWRAKSFLKSYDQHYLKRIRDDLQLANENVLMGISVPSDATTPKPDLPPIQNLTLENQRKVH
ncbi:hypothetical protein NM688_g3867 [Phlebia brevispora]|uniref:Uncharacterized protein n=1 Tax=Phlebia brevispora TaxID=194682 RepID=A0ACC1T4H8_9APHY|nr:hypothetical protein NM688_g3867 [Phlebia brevispora]